MTTLGQNIIKPQPRRLEPPKQSIVRPSQFRSISQAVSTKKNVLTLVDAITLIFVENKGTKLGEGAYGEVWAIDDYIVKRLKTCNDEDSRIALKREYDILHYLDKKCPGSFPKVYEQNIYLNGATNKYECFILMERIEGMNGEQFAKSFYRQRVRIDRKAMERVMYFLLQGLTCMHRLNYYHHDIKPPNIVISSTDDRAVFVDLGLVCITGNVDQVGDKNCLALTSYDSPEILLERSRGKYYSWRKKKDANGKIILGRDGKPVREYIQNNRGSTVPVNKTTQDFWNKVDVYDLGITFKIIMYPEVLYDEDLYINMESYPSQDKMAFGELDYLVNAMLNYNPRDRPTSFETFDLLKIITGEIL